MKLLFNIINFIKKSFIRIHVITLHRKKYIILKSEKKNQSISHTHKYSKNKKLDNYDWHK